MNKKSTLFDKKDDPSTGLLERIDRLESILDDMEASNRRLREELYTYRAPLGDIPKWANSHLRVVTYIVSEDGNTSHVVKDVKIYPEGEVGNGN